MLYLPIDGDEGQFVYQAQQVLDGKIPLKEILSYTPLFTYLEALFVKVFGYNVLSGRILTVTMNTLAVVFTYAIAKELYNKKVGLISAFIYALSPAALIYNTVGNYREVAFPLEALGILALVLALKDERPIYFALFGAIIGFATWVYRASAIFLLTVPFLLLYVNHFRIRDSIKKYAFVIVGAMVTFVPIFLYFAYNSSLEWVNLIWGFGGGKGSVTDYLSSQAVTGSAVSPVSILYERVIFLGEYLNFISRVAYVVTFQWVYVIIPSLIFLVLVLKWKIKERRHLLLSTSCLLAILFVVMLARGEMLPPRGPWGTTPAAWIYETTFFMSFLFMVPLALTVAIDSNETGKRLRFTDALILFWITNIVMVLLSFYRVHVFYFDHIASPLTIATAIALCAILDFQGRTSTFIKKKSLRRLSRLSLDIADRNFLRLVLLALLIISSLNTALMFASTPVGERAVTREMAAAIGGYIQRHTSVDDEIFTGNVIFAVYANRKNVLGISSPWPLLHPLNPFPYDPYGAAASAEDVLEELEKGKARYVTLEDYAINILNSHPILDHFIGTHYTVETTIYDVPILKWMGTTQTGENLLSNGDFKSESYGWTLANTLYNNVTTAYSHSGNASLQVTRENIEYNVFSELISVEGNTTYLVGGYIKYLCGNSSFKIAVEFLDENKSHIAHVADWNKWVYAGSPSNWTYVYNLVTTSPNVSFVSVIIGVGTETTVLFDDIMFSKVIYWSEQD